MDKESSVGGAQVSSLNFGSKEKQIQQYEPSFDDFWLLVVRKVAKYETKQEWNKLTNEERLAAIEGAAKWRTEWLKMDLKFILHPDRFLRRHRWEDELPVQNTVTSAAHVAFTPKDETPRGVMPDNVRALLTKLKGKG